MGFKHQLHVQTLSLYQRYLGDAAWLELVDERAEDDAVLQASLACVVCESVCKNCIAEQT